MQYGNPIIFGFFATKRASGLNRTMQYGNNLNITQNEIHGKFKSYYVVWKRYDTHGEKNPM